ncbi:hypothetical protein FDP41_005785 [Naegleria fowleri]|uniref:Homeobox domain-containing protein n=1 Tax=Naegleria fowleri TaxID=5763 RepID=A0A6A5BJI4_NAEFO|nr:uncharacterized protein FDP41_005785 [Naegleria fowleri]KAF0975032.1 hypothetical protein FDP41_005785 [Naegleria fowleri]CAG4716204.1 unnamed protein product [Naegleria fowleri]
MTLPNKLNYDPKQIAIQRRYLLQQRCVQQQPPLLPPNGATTPGQPPTMLDIYGYPTTTTTTTTSTIGATPPSSTTTTTTTTTGQSPYPGGPNGTYLYGQSPYPGPPPTTTSQGVYAHPMAIHAQQQQQALLQPHQLPPGASIGPNGTIIMPNGMIMAPHHHHGTAMMGSPPPPAYVGAAGTQNMSGMSQQQQPPPLMASPSTSGKKSSSKKRKSQQQNASGSHSNETASQVNAASDLSPPPNSKKKKSKKKESSSANASAASTGDGTNESQSNNNNTTNPTPPAIPFGNSAIIKSPKMIKEEIQQINDMFGKAIDALIDRFNAVKIRSSNTALPGVTQNNLLLFKEEEKYKPKEEEIITTFPTPQPASSAQQDSDGEQNPSTSVAPSQAALFNTQQQTKLLQNYPVFISGKQNPQVIASMMPNEAGTNNGVSGLYEEEKNRKPFFYKDASEGEYILVEDIIEEIIDDLDSYFKRETLAHHLSEYSNNIFNLLKERLVSYIESNRESLTKFLLSADSMTFLGQYLAEKESFQHVTAQLRNIIDISVKKFEEKTKEEANTQIILSSGSTVDATDEAIDQFGSNDPLPQDYSKNVSLIEMTPKDILLVFLGKDTQNEKQEDVNTFLERFKELQKQYRIECGYIDDGMRKWQEAFERVLNNQSKFRIVTFEERHRCKKSLEARFSVMKQLLKDKYLTKVLSLQENTLLRSKRRGNLPRHATNVLKSWLFSHFLHPYPSESEKKDLCMETGLTLTQVNNWFINQRVRTWRPMLESMLEGEKDKTTSESTPQPSASSTRPASESGSKKRSKKNQQASSTQQSISQPIMQMSQQTVIMPNPGAQMMTPDMTGAAYPQHYTWSNATPQYMDYIDEDLKF